MLKNEDSAALAGELAELKVMLEHLQSAVAVAVQRSAPVGCSEVDEASRIISMANRTAEAAIAEARVEAAAIVEAAEARSRDLVRAAEEAALGEVEAERAQIVRVKREWAGQVEGIASLLRGLSDVLSTSRRGLEATTEAIESALAAISTDETPPVIDGLPAADAWMMEEPPSERPPREWFVDLTTARDDLLRGESRTNLFRPEPAGTAASGDTVSATTVEVGAEDGADSVEPDRSTASDQQRALRLGRFGR